MKQKILLIDNFDSFVYNLFQSISALGHRVDVKRNNEITIEDIQKKGYSRIVISPGPGNPTNEKDFGICSKAISSFGKTIPILGVCLGHQGIVAAFGGEITKAKKPMHGKTSKISHDGKGLFSGLKNPLTVMRYHSLIANESLMPDCLEITARSNDDKAVMGIKHKSLPIFGVQFHPESIFTDEGNKIIENFCEAPK